MRAAFQTAVAMLYPPRCLGCGIQVESDFGLCGPCWRDTPFIGGTVCETCGLPLMGAADGQRIECDSCMARPRPWTDGRAALLYADRGRRLVLSLKHADRTDIARPAGRWMARAAKPILNADMLVAPVPLHRLRLIKRRYNQAALLAKEVAGLTGLDYCPDLLIRRRRTPSLDGKGVAARHDAVKGAICVHPGRRRRLAGRHILIVDDVMTSGATLGAAAEAALSGGAAAVSVVTLARVVQDDYIRAKDAMKDVSEDATD
jgi:predicted amidophosphoribosyltransferase